MEAASRTAHSLCSPPDRLSCVDVPSADWNHYCPAVATQLKLIQQVTSLAFPKPQPSAILKRQAQCPDDSAYLLGETFESSASWRRLDLRLMYMYLPLDMPGIVAVGEFGRVPNKKARVTKTLVPDGLYHLHTYRTTTFHHQSCTNAKPELFKPRTSTVDEDVDQRQQRPATLSSNIRTTRHNGFREGIKRAQVICEGQAPLIPARQAQHQPWHIAHQDRERRRLESRILLPGQAHRICLPRQDGDSGHKNKGHLGQGYKDTRQLGSSKGAVQTQPATQVVRRDGADHALPERDMSMAKLKGGCLGGWSTLREPRWVLRVPFVCDPFLKTGEDTDIRGLPVCMLISKEMAFIQADHLITESLCGEGLLQDWKWSPKNSPVCFDGHWRRGLLL
nr:hypothetical protein CFP56_34890 [Quercus suber]